MTQQQIIKTALEQSALDSGCDYKDFISGKSKVVISKPNAKARRYLELPFVCDLTSYGSNIVASVSPEFEGIAADYIARFATEHCFETPNLHVFMDALRPYGVNACFMAEYFLPKLDRLIPLECGYEIKFLPKEELSGLYLPQWGNALCEKRKELDVLAVGAYDKEKLIALAGCSADCDTMWQIGIDVLPPYRKQGIAAALTSRIALECINRDIVPFYCCAWSNIPSARNAIKSGFVPAWVQLTAKSSAFINDMNGISR